MLNLKATSYILMAVSILFLFHYNLMSALIGGMTAFLIVNNFHSFIGTKVHSKWAHKATVLAMATFTVGLLSLIGIGIHSGLNVGQSNFVNLSDDVLNVLQQLRNYLPESVVQYIPENILELKAQATEMLKKNAPNMLSFTSNSAHGLFNVIVGMLVGAVIAFSFLKDNGVVSMGPFTKVLLDRLSCFSSVFQKVVFAQVKISAINTILTGIYLLAILPLMGINIPYAKTLVLLTFLFGLLPVIGNLISNTLITLLSLMVSFEVALGSLAFLVIVHKLEYYVNAKIVGEEIKTSIWEMLIVMLLMDAAFGVIGAVLSPVIYGYIKEELRKNRLI